jgi:transaldolase
MAPIWRNYCSPRATRSTASKLKVKLFTDGADKTQIVVMAKQSWIAGFTTNPSLLKMAGGNVEIIWASTREVFNVVEADAMGCHISTAPADVLKKLPVLGTRTVAELSLGAVKSFREDAIAAGLKLAVPASQARRDGHFGDQFKHSYYL